MTAQPTPPPVAFTADDSGRSVLDQLEDHLTEQGVPITIDRESYPSMGPYVVAIGGDRGGAGWLCLVLRQDGPPSYTISTIAADASLARVIPRENDTVVVFPAVNFSTPTP